MGWEGSGRAGMVILSCKMHIYEAVSDKSESQWRVRKTGSGKKLNQGSTGSQGEQHKPSGEGQGCL